MRLFKRQVQYVRYKDKVIQGKTYRQTEQSIVQPWRNEHPDEDGYKKVMEDLGIIQKVRYVEVTLTELTTAYYTQTGG